MNKTYQATVTKPMLEVWYDNDTESPRDWDNVGYFITEDDRTTSSPENLGKDKQRTIYNCVLRTAADAGSQEEHIKLIKKEIKAQTGEKVMEIYPVNKYEHGGVSYSLGTKHGFDYSNNGFYIVTDKSQEGKTYHESFKPYIEKELEIFNKWANGEVYGFTLYDGQGGIVDSIGGFYSLEDIKENLPKEWQKEDLSQYFN